MSNVSVGTDSANCFFAHRSAIAVAVENFLLIA
jgi:hypothetical protein